MPRLWSGTDPRADVAGKAQFHATRPNWRRAAQQLCRLQDAAWQQQPLRFPQICPGSALSPPPFRVQWRPSAEQPPAHEGLMHDTDLPTGRQTGGPIGRSSGEGSPAMPISARWLLRRTALWMLLVTLGVAGSCLLYMAASKAEAESLSRATQSAENTAAPAAGLTAAP